MTKSASRCRPGPHHRTRSPKETGCPEGITARRTPRALAETRQESKKVQVIGIFLLHIGNK